MKNGKPNPRRRHLVLGAGPAGLTAGYLLAKRGEPVIVLEAVRQRRRPRADRGPRRLPLRPRRPSLLHQEPGGRGPLAGAARRPSCSCGGGSRASTGAGGSSTTRCALGDVVRKVGPAEVARSGASYAAAHLRPRPERRDLRGLGLAALRAAAVRALLPLLHREGLGRAHLRDPRRVGGAAHPRPVAVAGGEVGDRAPAAARSAA